MVFYLPRLVDDPNGISKTGFGVACRSDDYEL